MTRAWKGDWEAAWELWVATDNYDDAPKVRNNNELAEGSKAPISESYASPFVGKTLEDCAKWLQQAPSDVAIDKEYFTALVEHSKEEDTVMACRINGSDESGELDIEYFPQGTDTIVQDMMTNGGLKWNEKAWNYAAARMNDGKPDRSKVKARP